MRTKEQIIRIYHSAKQRKLRGFKSGDDTGFKIGCALVEMLKWILYDELDENGHKIRDKRKTLAQLRKEW